MSKKKNTRREIKSPYTRYPDFPEAKPDEVIGYVAEDFGFAVKDWTIRHLKKSRPELLQDMMKDPMSNDAYRELVDDLAWSMEHRSKMEKSVLANPMVGLGFCYTMPLNEDDTNSGTEFTLVSNTIIVDVAEKKEDVECCISSVRK
ncbi:hypothetical protein [Cutibacterium avidum]|uniref:hypothetical protein n=1 Tax=Cutibacterium avidum TaxID=33010 RepID=UPI001EF7281A|nr:hypothetical protein [Cutibacterium avidum]MCG7370387.1 hypothetical protein [Cutibacterium avidum]